MKEALVVMAKAPRAGEVKTRLIGLMDAEEARQLYLAFLSDTFALMEEIMEEREALSLILCYTPEGEEEAFEEVEREGSLMIPQRGGHLGERLAHCFTDVFALGHQSVVVIGADTPTLPGELLFDAFEALEQQDDVVIGPSVDGGYYLIGMRRPHPALFSGIPWGSGGVFAATQANAAQDGAHLIVMPEWYDVDTPEQLAFLKQELKETRESAHFSRRFLKERG